MKKHSLRAALKKIYMIWILVLAFLLSSFSIARAPEKGERPQVTPAASEFVRDAEETPATAVATATPAAATATPTAPPEVFPSPVEDPVTENEVKPGSTSAYDNTSFSENTGSMAGEDDTDF